MKAKVYQKSKRRWYVQLWWQGKRYRRYYYSVGHNGNLVPLSSYELADDLCRSINGDIANRGKAFQPRVWFREDKSAGFGFTAYVEKWLETKQFAPSYGKDVESMFRRYWNPVLGGYDIREIRAGQLRDLRDALPTHLSGKSKSNILTQLHSVFRTAFDREEIYRIPPFPRVRVSEPELKWLVPADVKKVFGCISARDRAIFEFGYYYALRPGEVRALMWDAVDFKQKIVTIKRTFSGVSIHEHTKNRRVRKLPLIQVSEQILRYKGIHGFVFKTERGKPYRKQRLQSLWHQAREEAGVQPIPLYNAMRHSRAMELLDDGWPIAELQEYLGHSRVEMTQRYARAHAGMMRRRLSRGGE